MPLETTSKDENTSKTKKEAKCPAQYGDGPSSTEDPSYFHNPKRKREPSVSTFSKRRRLSPTPEKRPPMSPATRKGIENCKNLKI